MLGEMAETADLLRGESYHGKLAQKKLLGMFEGDPSEDVESELAISCSQTRLLVAGLGCIWLSCWLCRFQGDSPNNPGR